MSASPLHVAVPEGTDPYWLDLLARSGLAVRELGTCDHRAATVFLPDAAGLSSSALRALVAARRAAGEPLLLGAPWARALGVPVATACDLGVGLRPTDGTWLRSPGPLVALPLPTAERLQRTAARLTTWSGPSGLAAAEVVAVADHGGLRRCVTAALRWLAFAAGRPFVHLAHAPMGYDGVLAFRIDADDHRGSATDAVLRELAAAGQRATWFIDVARHVARGGMGSLAAIRAHGHEIQSHGYRHYTYRTRTRNRDNLRRSLEVLTVHGHRPTAAAAPFGSWNRGFAEALRDCGLRWSSEFSRAYDDVPGAFGEAGAPWQVPVHPVCPALLFAAGADAAGVRAWFTAELAACLARREPAVFYGHPIDDLGRCPGLPSLLVAQARQAGRSLWQPTLGELHDFHRARAAARSEARWNGTDVIGDVDGPAPMLVEAAGTEPVAMLGDFVFRWASPSTAVLVPTPYRPRARQRHRLRTHRLQLARLWREVRS